MQQEGIERARQIVEELLEKGGFVGYSVEMEQAKDRGETMVMYSVRTHSRDSRFLIGQYGDNLHALQHLVHLIVRKEFGNEKKFPFVVDVNGYRKQKDRSIIDLAKSAAREARKDNKSMLLRPMTAYERRLVHMAITADVGVITESIGSEKERKVVIKPLDLTEK